MSGVGMSDQELCYNCGEEPHDNNSYCLSCYREINNRNRRLRRQKLIENLGGECECCGENAREFLAFDHPEGGGSAAREEKGAQYHLFKGRHEELRILCHNCNLSLGFYRYCPHQTIET